MVIDHNFYMKLALEEAWKYQGLTYPNPAVGCCVIDENGTILGVEAHKKAGFAHAEVEALKSAFYRKTNDENILNLTQSKDISDYLINNHKDIFFNCSLYVTLEPCSKIGKTPACSNLIKELKIKNVYIGSKDIYQDSFGNGAVYGVMQQECDELLEPFYRWQNNRFVFFKWAQRLNATYDGGIITSQQSRLLVHKMRDVCDLIVIGGDTVRVDRPILDARLCGGKAPDVFIYSKNKSFDLSIPLFGVKNRKVIISDDLDSIKGYKNIMIEGGNNMYDATKHITDFYITFIAPKFGGEKIFTQSNEEFNFLNIQKVSDDIMIWSKRMKNNG